MSNRVEYNERLIARVPEPFPRLVSAAAGRNLISPSAYIRQAIREKLTRDGYNVETVGGFTAPSCVTAV